MKKIEVKIKEIDKGTRDLTLLNLREEVVNFLYKDTVANSTRADLQFFVLLYFIVIRSGNKTFLEKILDEGVPKFNKLNKAFSAKKGYLRAREYRKMVEEYGLSELFENDIFFVIVESILNVKEIKTRYTSFLKKHTEVEQAVKAIEIKYAKQLNISLNEFQSSRIQDDRYDEYGNHHDLSKSVYRTVRMRNSRNLDLNLQKYTSIRELTSKSPVDLNFLQHIDPQIIFDLWDKYHVTGYMRSVWRIANDSPIISGVLGGLVVNFTKWKRTDGKKNRNEKDKARQEFEKSKQKNGQVFDDLTLRLVDSVLRANERLEKEIGELKTKLRELSSQDISMQDKTRIKKLEERITQLENLEVSANEVTDLKK